MGGVFVLFIISLLIICTAVILLSLVLAKKTNFNREKSSPFECGFDPNSRRRLPFSLRFFLIAVFFLIFDVELLVIFPVVMGMFSVNPVVAGLVLVVFLVILI